CGQNLVLNPSFELSDTCHINANSPKYPSYWSNPLMGFSSPDYFNACDTFQFDDFGIPKNSEGYEAARTGVAYVGIATGAHNPNPLHNSYREYFQGQFLE